MSTETKHGYIAPLTCIYNIVSTETKHGYIQLFIKNLTGDVQNVRFLNCATIVWEAPAHGSILEYRVRMVTGSNINSRDRIVLTVDPRQTWAIPSRLPAEGPVYAAVSHCQL